jgi:leucyl aminopeptidase (aminopeptidase T)
MRYREGLLRLFRENFRLRRRERVLVFADVPPKGAPAAWVRQHRCAREAAELAAELAGEATLVEYPPTGTAGMEPPAGLWAAVFGEAAVERLRRSGVLERILAKRASARDIAAAERALRGGVAEAPKVVLGLARYSTTHTRFRSFTTGLAGARYASMPLFDPLMFEGPMAVDWKEVARKTRACAAVLNRALRVVVRAPNGTYLRMDVRGRTCHPDDGLLHVRGKYGNLPAGEAFLAPLEGTAQGVLVAEWAQTERPKRPMTLWVRDGLLHEVEGEGPAAEQLRRKVRENAANANVAELGVGTNPGAKRPENILESEKILGTVHVAFGDNHGFGGKVAAPFHQDYVVFAASLTAELPGGRRREILREGRWML